MEKNNRVDKKELTEQDLLYKQKQKEIKERQQQINQIRNKYTSEELEDITLREILDREVRPIEGQDFKEYVQSGALKNIEWTGEKTNKSQTYNIK